MFKCFSFLHGYKTSVFPKEWEFHALGSHLHSHISIILLSQNIHFDEYFHVSLISMHIFDTDEKLQ